MRTTPAVLAVVLLGLPARADDAAAEAHAKIIAPYINDQTFLVAHVDISRVNLDIVAKYVDADNQAKVKAVAALAKATFLGSGGKDIYVVMNWANPMDEVLVVAPLAKGAGVQALAQLAGQIPGYQVEVKNNVLLAGTKKAMARLNDFKPLPIPEMAKAFAAVDEGSLQVVFLPPFALKRAFIEMYPQLPKEIGGGDSSVLNFQWAAARLDAADALAAKIVVQAPDAKAADKIDKVLRRAMAFAGNSEDVKRNVPDAAKIVALLAPTVQADRLVLTMNDKDMTTVLLPLLARQREAASQAVSTNNLKQIALAMHNYLDVHRTFPAAATYNAQGQPLLSWRVYLLPFIEQDALFRAFRLDEPWDSEHNKKLIAQMPVTYRSPAQKNLPQGKTTYLAPVGPKTIFDGKKGMPIQKITDGTSNTIMIVEADDSRAVFWTQPEDYKIDAKDPLAGLVRRGARGFHAAFADGSVRLLPDTIDPVTLRALYTANGGEVVQLP
jgi:hypothetical protein